MTKKVIDITGQIELEYDKNSPDFKESFAGYQKSIDVKGTINEMLQHVVSHILKFGPDEMVEGVGFINLPGEEMPSEVNSGITVHMDLGEFEIEVQ